MCYSGKCPHENAWGECELDFGVYDCPPDESIITGAVNDSSDVLDKVDENDLLTWLKENWVSENEQNWLDECEPVTDETQELIDWNEEVHFARYGF